LGEQDHSQPLPNALQPVVSHAMRIAFAYAFNEAVTIASTEYTKWSSCRKVVQRMVCSAYETYLAKHDAEQLPMDIESLADIVNELNALEDVDADAEPHPSSKVSTVVILRAFDEKDVQAVRVWSDSIGKTNVRFHPEYIKMQESLLAGMAGIASVGGLLKCIKQCVFDAMPATSWWIIINHVCVEIVCCT